VSRIGGEQDFIGQRDQAQPADQGGLPEDGRCAPRGGSGAIEDLCHGSGLALTSIDAI
jgi:hypothetical protein